MICVAFLTCTPWENLHAWLCSCVDTIHPCTLEGTLPFYSSGSFFLSFFFSPLYILATLIEDIKATWLASNLKALFYDNNLKSIWLNSTFSYVCFLIHKMTGTCWKMHFILFVFFWVDRNNCVFKSRKNWNIF